MEANEKERQRCFIKFLGTGGARFVVSRQLRSSGGIWCCFKGDHFLIDPGPGTLVRCFSSRPKLNPEELGAIILTHRHLDHSSDMNVMVESMTGGRTRKRGVVFIPPDAVNCREPVIFKYLQDSLERLELLSQGNSYAWDQVSFQTPVAHDHGVETYGLKFSLGGLDISFIVDTAFFPGLVESYRAQVIILNVVLYKHPGHHSIKHLDLGDCRKIIQGIQPQLAVLTHFGLTMLKHKPWKLARALEEETGVKVVAAYDGMALDLNGYMGQGANPG